jgi:hypothetical protein
MTADGERPFGFGIVGRLIRRGAPLRAHWRRKYAGSVAHLINEGSNVEIARAVIAVAHRRGDAPPAERTVINWVSKIRNSRVEGAQ